MIANVRTLYSYLSGEDGIESKAWAIDKMKRGKNFVVEIIDDKICFAPSRFVGYVNNTIDKHEENHGDGTQTDNLMLQFYTKVTDERLEQVFQEAIEPFEISTGSKKYWIPLGMTVEDVLSTMGDDSAKQRLLAAQAEAQKEKAVTAFSEYKGPTAQANRRPVPPQFRNTPSQQQRDPRAMTKSELKAYKKQEKIEAKFKKEMAKRGGY